MPSEEQEDYSACILRIKSRRNSSSSMISSIRHKQSISCTFLKPCMDISVKEMPKNHNDKERFTAASEIF